MTKKSKLTPPDHKRCQAEWKEGSFMTLGPRSMIRCPNPPAIVVRERQPGKDGRRGSMSLCPACAVVLFTRQPPLAVDVTRILIGQRKPKISWPKAEKLQRGMVVKTVADAGAEDWAEPDARQWGVAGVVIDRSDAHGCCYCVVHPDGVLAWYEYSELAVVAMP
jgi:hypothetical protein